MPTVELTHLVDDPELDFEPIAEIYPPRPLLWIGSDEADVWTAPRTDCTVEIMRRPAAPIIPIGNARRT